MVSVHVFKVSVMINTIRKLYCLYLYPLCKLTTAIIAKQIVFFNISESMHDNEINLKNCYKTYTFLFYAN